MLVIEKFYFNILEFTEYICSYSAPIFFKILLWFCMDQTLLLTITSLILLVMPFLLYVKNHQKQSIPHWNSSPSIARMVWFFKVSVSYYSQETTGGGGGMLRRDAVVHREILESVHYMHYIFFLQAHLNRIYQVWNLHGTEMSWTTVAQSASTEIKRSPFYWKFPSCFLNTQRNDLITLSEIDSCATCLQNIARKTFLILR